MHWSGKTAVILACGPSLTDADVLNAHGSAGVRTIAVNNSWRMAPFADALYAADPDWWLHCAPPLDAFHGERWTQHRQWNQRPKPPKVQEIQSELGDKISDDPSYIYTGSNSAFQAMGLAINWGARRVIFLGLDLSRDPDGRNHWFGDYPDPIRNCQSYPRFIQAFETVAPILQERGIQVINASRRTALNCFPKMTIEGALRA